MEFVEVLEVFTSADVRIFLTELATVRAILWMSVASAMAMVQSTSVDAAIFPKAPVTVRATLLMSVVCVVELDQCTNAGKLII